MISHHRTALLTVAAATALDAALGVLYAAVTPGLPVWHGLYCALANAVTLGGDVAPADSAGYAVQAAECLTVVPLFAATLSLFTSGLTAGHVNRAEKRIKDHISNQTGGSNVNQATSRPAVFRAGGETTGTPDLTGTTVTLLADVSEYQPNITDAAYLEWSKAIVIRAMYGADHVDGAWYDGERRANLHTGGVRFLGLYQFIVADQDPAEQAQALAKLLGPLQAGEKIVADIEVGEGDQRARWQAWAKAITDAYGADAAPWSYANLDYAAEHDLSPVDWVAAYRDTAPDVTHILWQFSETYNVPGVGVCDCSRFLGTIEQLAAHGWQGTAPKPAPTAPTVTVTLTLPVLSIGDDDADLRHWYVRRVQTILNDVYSATLTPDGDFGTLTKAAVEAFQQANGLTVDGRVGGETWTALYAGTAAA